MSAVLATQMKYAYLGRNTVTNTEAEMQHR